MIDVGRFSSLVEIQMLNSERESRLVSEMRRHGYATLEVNWPDPGPSETFARFAELVDLIDTPRGPDGLAAVDAVLLTRTTGNPRHATSLFSDVRYKTRTAVLYGHTYFHGTLDAVERQCLLPGPVAALWRSLEEVFGVVDRQLRRALRGLDGVGQMPSSLRVWKYVYNDMPWCSHPHYDATAFSALIASQNPEDELLSVGLEANGAPIELVRERVRHLRQLQPSPGQLCCVFPGVFANRWDFEPTWHYVRQLPRPSACRYSLIWGLLHPESLPVKMSQHISSLSRTAKERVSLRRDHQTMSGVHERTAGTRCEGPRS